MKDSKLFSLLIQFLLPALSMLCAGCQGDQVGGGLDQNKANHMVAVLTSNGIGAAARKESAGRGTYGVWVDPGSRGEAAVLIDEKGLLEKGEASFDELVSNQGILPGSREMEQLKLDRAQAIEMERLLENLPGVVSARVVLRSRFLREGEKASIAVVVEEQNPEPGRAEQIRSIISGAVPGVEAGQVLVSVHAGEIEDTLRQQIGMLNIKGKPVPVALDKFLGLWRVPRDDSASLAFTLVGLILACGFIGAIAGYWYSYYAQSRRLFDQHPGDLVPKVTRMEVGKDRNKLAPIDLAGGEWTPGS